MSGYKVITDQIEKPDLDDRSYRYIELPNKLNALIIHDPSTDKSAASLDCNVGAFNDPKDLPGLAHFLEHLLFMGTAKYPNENDYRSYLSNHSGHSNAYTSKLNTNYYFEVNHNYLEGALDRFAQFFIHPLFDANCKDREIKAVDSENKKNLQNDIWRLSHLDKSLASEKHPYNGFSTGNIKTLGEIPSSKGMDVREELIKFYKEHYSSNLMKLVVLGKEDLDVLTDWVVSKFSEVPNQNKSPSYFENPPFTEKEQLKVIRAKPVMNTKSLEITFSTSDQSANWGEQPQHYFSHLIGHEGKGSILYYLKEKGWASGLSCGSYNVSKDFSIFSVDVNLTDKGLEHYEEILVSVFQYIKMLQNVKAQEWIFNELKDVSKLNFKFKQKTGASGTVSKLSSVLNKIDPSLPVEYILSQNVIRNYDADLINKYAEHFSTDNFRITLVSPTFKDLPLREKWYGTEYSIDDLSDELLSKLKNCTPNESLRLPEPNEFIAKNFEVAQKPVKEVAKAPALIKTSDLQRVWYKKDDQFWVPRGAVSTMFHLPVSQTTPIVSTMSTLYLELVDDFLNDIAYNASIVGLSFQLNPTRDGFSLKISGYNDKLLVLLEKVLDTLLSFEPSANRFELIKEKILKDYNNFGYNVPYAQIGYYSTYLLYDQSWSIEEKIEALKNIKHDDMKTFIATLYKQTFLETFVHGNFTKDIASKVFEMYETKFNSIAIVSDSQAVTGRSTLISPGMRYRYDVMLKDAKNVNSCIEYLIQLGELTDIRSLTLADLVAQVSHEPCFTELRTNQQLGYVVFSGVKKTRTTFGYRVLIQSERTTDYLEYRIEDFLEQFGNKLKNFSEEEFKKNVESLVAKKLLKLKNLNEEHGRMWGKIGSGYYDFFSHEKQVEVLHQLELKDLVGYYHDNILNSETARLVTHLKSQSPPVQAPKKLINVAISNAVQEVSSNKLEELINAHEFSSYDAEEIHAFIISTSFKELISASPKIDLKALETQILSDLKNPTPSKYPTGQLITSVADFKGDNILTKTARPVAPLEEYVDKEEFNDNPKL